MNKKLLAFGFLSFFVIALATAALVPYLSNTVSGSVNVETPLVLSGGEFSVGTPDAFNLIVEDFTLINLANTDIPAIVETEISTENSDFSDVNIGEEFVVLKIGLQVPNLETCNAIGGIDYNEDAEGYCYFDASTDKDYSGVVNGNYYVQMGDRSNPNPVPALATMNGRLKIQFDVNIEPDLYTFTSQALNPQDSKDLE